MSTDRGSIAHRRCVACGNEKARYSGDSKAPRATAAFRSGAGTLADAPAKGQPGTDGETWQRVQ